MPMACFAGSRVSTTAVAVTTTKLRMVNCRNSIFAGLLALFSSARNLRQAGDLFALGRLPMAAAPNPGSARGGMRQNGVHQKQHHYDQAHLDGRLAPTLFDDHSGQQSHGRDRAY